MAQARVSIIADASGVRRGVRDAERHLGRLNGVGKTTAGVFAGINLDRAVQSVVRFGFSAVKAAQESEAAMAKTKAMVEAAGVSWEKYGEQIEKAAAAQSKRTGFDDEEVAKSIANITRVTKDHTTAIKYNETALDLARGKSIDLATASNIISKVAGGNTSILQRYSIQVEKGATAQEALAAIQKQFAGQSDAYARTTAGAAARAGVAWENLKEDLGQKVAPGIARALTAVTEVLNRQGPAWDAVRRWAQVLVNFYNRNLRAAVETIYAVFKRVWEAIGPVVRTNLEIVKNIVQGIMAVLRGDWGDAWDNIKRIPKLMLKEAAQLIKGMASLIYDAMKYLGKKAMEGFIAGLKDLKGAVSSALGLDSRIDPALAESIFGAGSPLVPRRRMGGYVGGPRGAGDVVPILASPGEVVLNERQQGALGVGRIMQVLAATGGKVGMGGFARGGVVDAAAKFARAQVGEPYVRGGGHAFGDFRAWDCSGFASNVAARVPGYTGGIGTTMSLYPRSTPARGNEPVVFGFRGMQNRDPFKQHMGIRVNGTWYDAGSGGVQTGDSRWDSVRVPPGLSYLAEGNGPDAGGQPKSLPVAPFLKGIMGGTEAPTSTPEAAQRGFATVGMRAELSALAGGATLEAAQEAADDARRNAEIKWWQDEKRRSVAERDRMITERGQAVARLRTLYKNGVAVKERKAVAALQARIKQLNESRAAWTAWIGECDYQLLQLEVAEAEDKQEIGLPGADSAAAAATADDGVSAAQLAQAQERAAVATRSAGYSDAFISTAFGRGDLGTGGSTAWGAAGGVVNVTVQSLTPSDPTTLQTIGQVVSAALGYQGAVFSPAVNVGV